MTTLREAAQQALEAKQTPLIELLERIPQDARLVVEHDQFSSSVHPVGRLCHEAAAALRAALAEPVQEPVWVCPDSAEHRYGKPGHCEDCGKTLVQVAEPVQEPVAWLFTNLQSGDYDFCYQEDEHDHDREMWHKQPLYTAPPQRKPLAEDEIALIVADCSASAHRHDDFSFARAIERAHGIGGQE